MTEIKSYTETVEGVSIGTGLDEYGVYRFYTVFAYTGHQDLFQVPDINVDVGAKVNARLVQIRTRFALTPANNSEPHCFAYHRGKRLIIWKKNLAMELAD